MEAYAPLGSPARPGVKDEEPVVMNDPVILDIAQKRNMSPGQVYAIIINLFIGHIINGN